MEGKRECTKRRTISPAGPLVVEGSQGNMCDPMARQAIDSNRNFCDKNLLELAGKELCAGNKDQLALESREVMSAGAMHHALLQTGKEC
uniref:Uncharacterized protein n=1 Tax=Vespula pensylvanica TaxID=30213 RepID=A0A834P7S2_VESPE|nr:hypothetical protein H0235_004707 [Vespula pensylvanica]